MSDINTGGPAFPVKDVPDNFFGMTLRDYFAAKAMQELLSDQRQFKRDDIAFAAYDMADAMLKAREAK